MENGLNKTHTQKETACFNPILEIPDTTATEAFDEAKILAHIWGVKEASFLGVLLYVRFSKTIPHKEKNLAKCISIAEKEMLFDTVSAIGCIHDNGQEWYEMNALIVTLFESGKSKLKKKKNIRRNRHA